MGAAEYLEAQAKHDALNDPQAEAKAKKILKGFGFSPEQFDRRAKEFSGGWVMRAHLTRLLVIEPDLLLLDEPTNHLDLMSLLWFRGYLKNYPGAILLISHDRDFMDEIIETVYEIDQSKLNLYRGNYTDYEKQKEEKWEHLTAAYRNQQKEIEQIQAFIDRFRVVQSVAGAESGEAARQDGTTGKAAAVAKGVSFQFTPAGAWWSAPDRSQRCASGLWRSQGV